MLLADEASRSLYGQLLLFRVLGRLNVRFALQHTRCESGANRGRGTLGDTTNPRHRSDRPALDLSGAGRRATSSRWTSEGSELSALKGAETSIRRWRPKLAISLYHRPEDFFSIPLRIDSLSVGYNFFLDHYSIHNEETVLYAAA
jgi:hypothetical protein